MSYVAIKGGTEAIKASKGFFRSEITGAEQLETPLITQGLRFACDKVMGEGALYTEKLAAEAIRKSGGDLLEAAFYVRAHRSTCQRIGTAEPVSTEDIKIMRRISSAFKDIRGGQILGPSCDYVIRLFSQRREEAWQQQEQENPSQKDDIYLESALQPLKDEDKMKVLENRDPEPFDVTRSFPLPPYPRSALMQVMSRGETGALLAFAYTSMRGYGDVHPTIGDLRLGMVDIRFKHPFTGNAVKVGEIRVTTCETVGSFNRDPRDGKVRLSVGFGFCFGFNETKAISMSILDLGISHTSHSIGGQDIAANPEIIIHHVDGIESMGFTNHFKLPHYVTFQADLHTFNKAKQNDE